MQRPMYLLFESLNVCNLALTLLQIRTASRVILFRSYDIGSLRGPQHSKRLATWLVRIINPQVEVTNLEKEVLHPLAYLDNYESRAPVDDLAGQIRVSECWRMIQEVVRHDMLERMYKRYLLDLVLPTSQFYRYGKMLVADGVAVRLVPSAEDHLGIDKSFFTGDELYGLIPAGVRVFNRTKRVIIVALSVLPLANLVRLSMGIGYHLVKRGRRLRGRQATVEADVITPLIWGFADEQGLDGRADTQSKAKRLEWDNSFIFRGPSDIGRVAVYFSDWPFTPIARARQSEFMTDKGIRYFDPDEFGLDWEQFRSVGRVIGKVIGHMLSKPRILWEQPHLCGTSGRILYVFLEEMLFNRRVRFRVRMEWADYAAASVMRTVVANLFGRSTVGIHHNCPDGPYGFPQIRYTYVNRYCVWGKAVREMFGKDWDAMECETVGIPRLDAGVRAMDRRQQLEARYRERFRGKYPVVFVTLPNPPGNVSYQIEARFQEFWCGLVRCCEEFPEFSLVLRPRFQDHWQAYLCDDLVRRLMASARAVVDMAEFSTYEWIAISDLVITNSISSVGIEAASMGKRCFVFDSMGLATFVYGKYGEDLVLTTSTDVCRAIAGVFDESRQVKCDWERLATDYCAFNDGKNTDRFREVIWRGIA